MCGRGGGERMGMAMANWGRLGFVNFRFWEVQVSQDWQSPAVQALFTASYEIIGSIPGPIPVPGPSS